MLQVIVYSLKNLLKLLRFTLEEQMTHLSMLFNLQLGTLINSDDILVWEKFP